MAQPITMDIPHKLGREAVRQRLDGGIDRLAGMFPGSGRVSKEWQRDTLHFTVSAMGQTVRSTLEIFDDRVHATVDLPPMLALFAEKIREKLKGEATRLLR